MNGRVRPDEAPLAMPKQVLSERPRRDGRRPGSALWPKAFVGIMTILLTGFAVREMVLVLSVAGLIPLEVVLLVLFSINIAWIAFAFVSATAGFLIALFRRPSPVREGYRPEGRTALLFPVYKEDPRRVFATIDATAAALGESHPGAFECFVLSDTNDPEAALLEEAAFCELERNAPSGCPVHYRRRTINKERKSGNIEDFVSRWGGLYDYMVVFDADSYMERRTILELVARMEASPGTGLIQTIPQLVGGETIFARAQQFAAALYGPVLGFGVAWWAQSEGNFWGHNAIIRVRAFADAAALPALPGKAPFGGPILSHDFIEAALLRKAGWGVVIAPDLGGSYEECPPSIIDLTIRDRRWCQGNLQHLGVLFRTRGMAWTNRLHLMIGVMSYLAAPLWLLLIFVGMMLSLQAQFLRPDYFGDGVSLFPRWPVIDSARALSLFVITMAILFAPKVYGLVYGLASRLWRRRVGVIRTVTGVLAETVVSVLIAPILLVAQSTAVVSILLGRDAGWAPQQRAAGGYPPGAVFRRHFRTALLGLVLTGAAFAISPVFAAWLSPAALGMILAPLLSFWTGSLAAGRAAQRAGLLVTPEEVNLPPSVAGARARYPAYRDIAGWPAAEVIADGPRRARHAGFIDGHWPTAEGAVHVPLATALFKLQRGGGEEALMDLETAELMALINDREALEKAAGLARRDDGRGAA